MASASGRKRALPLLGFGVPFAAVAVLCLLLRTEPASLLAPAFGPWAGVLYGHHDCTLASASPPLALGLVVVGAAALAASRWVRAQPGRALALSLAGIWAVAWEFSALLSVLNTTS